MGVKKLFEHIGVVGRVLIGVGCVLLVSLVVLMVFATSFGGKAAHFEKSFDVVKDVAKETRPNTVDWAHWKEVNSDVVAWIEIPGTSIDMPVVQASEDNPTFYLSHDVYRDWNPWGAAYIDAGCKDGIDSLNVVIFGHHMAGPDTMFGEIADYHDQGYAEEHRLVIIYTPDEVREYMVYAVETIAGWEKIKQTEFNTMKEYQIYRDERLEASDVVLDHLENKGLVKMLMLVTCSYYFNPGNERTIAYAFEV